MVAFGIALALAYFFKWQTTDLIWSLWLGSLVVGYLTLATGILSDKVLNNKEEVSLKDKVVSALSTLAFFTCHFGFFHFIHSVFLQGFFPLEEDPNSSPFRIFPLTFQVLIPKYGWFLIPALIVQRLHLLKPLLGRQVKKEDNPKATGAPYMNVIKMHFLIFFFGACSFFNLENFFIYAIVYAFYFFPWVIIFKKKA